MMIKHLSSKETLKNRIKIVLLYLILAISLLIVVFPFVWMFLTSIKTVDEVRDFIFLPQSPQWENYLTVTQKVDIPNSMLNTLIVAFAQIPTGLFFSAMAAYSFSKLKLKHKTAKFMTIMSAMMMPYAAIMLPQYQIFRSFNLLNTLAPLFLPGMFGNTVAMFFFMQYMESISNSYLEAAKMDGCNSFRAFISIVLPLMKPALMAQAIFWFVAIWNDYFGPSIYLSDSRKLTLQVALAFLNSTNGVADKPLIMAAACITCLPLFIIYIIFQKHFVGSLSISGIKG